MIKGQPYTIYIQDKKHENKVECISDFSVFKNGKWYDLEKNEQGVPFVVEKKGVAFVVEKKDVEYNPSVIKYYLGFNHINDYKHFNIRAFIGCGHVEEKEVRIEETAIEVANKYVTCSMEKRVSKLGEEMMELAQAIAKNDLYDIEEELGDCFYILLDIAHKVDGSMNLDKHLLRAKNKMISINRK